MMILIFIALFIAILIVWPLIDRWQQCRAWRRASIQAADIVRRYPLRGGYQAPPGTKVPLNPPSGGGSAQRK
jgi:hypothetical protein